MKPIIGITFSDNIGNDPDNNYIKAVTAFGGEPRVLYPGVSAAAYAEIDGLLLTGGGDIHPENFGAAVHPSLKYVREDRDALELPLCREKIEADLPVLGICRGVQVMSVAMGGDLYQDIADEYPKETLEHPPRLGLDAEHAIEIESESLLSEIIGERVAAVNSAHHQAVKDTGGFRVTARSEDGIIEAMEDPSKRFVLGVQYHPERMTGSVGFREHRSKLFEAFIAAASA